MSMLGPRMAVCFLAIASSTPALGQYLMVPPRNVVLRCLPTRFVFHCSISRMANPQYESYCFYVAGGRSWLMRTDYRFGFYNDVVRINVHNGFPITARLTNLRSGGRAFCSEAS